MTTVTTAMLAEHEFFRGMRTPHLRQLVTAGRYIEVPARHRFFDEGGTADRFWLIHAGQIALDLHMPGRGAVIVETFGRGTVLGWSWLFPPYRWKFGALAKQPVRAIEFDGRLVRTLCAADPELGYELAHRFTSVILDRLQATRMRLVDVYAHPEEALWPPQ